MAEVIRTHRRGRIWPAFVMLLVVLLLIGIVVAMVMNLRGSVSWPAGRVEFGFRPNIFVTKTEPVNIVLAPSRLAADVRYGTPTSDETPSATPPEVQAEPVPSAQQTTPAEPDSGVPVQ